MSGRRLVLLVCGVFVVLGALAIVPELLLVYRSASYVLGYANDPPGGPYDVAFGTDRTDELHGGPGDDLLASEGPWGDPPEDYGPDRVRGGAGDDFVDSVSLPYPEELPVDVVRCGAGEDRVVADPQDDVDEDCEEVLRVDISLIPGIGDPLWEFPPEGGTREYGPSPYAGRSPD